jgi:hypothetical protein
METSAKVGFALLRRGSQWFCIEFRGDGVARGVDMVGLQSLLNLLMQARRCASRSIFPV